jgi:hypothetical protein
MVVQQTSRPTSSSHREISGVASSLFKHMTPLPIAFRSDGFEFEQLAREGDVALFRKTKIYKHSARAIKNYRQEPIFHFETFEVVVVQKMEEHQWPNGDVTPAHEHMPHSEQWATHGWSLQTRERAREKFRELI